MTNYWFFLQTSTGQSEDDALKTEAAGNLDDRNEEVPSICVTIEGQESAGSEDVLIPENATNTEGK